MRREGASGRVLLLAFLLIVTGPQAATLDREAAIAASRAAVGSIPANHRFVAADGRAVDLASFRGRPLVVSFVYTGCFQVCPASSQFLALAAEQATEVLGAGRFQMATVGFNLPFDSPEAMRDFARRHGLERPGWSFLSPSPAARDRLLADFGFRYVATAAGFDHVIQATIVDADGRIVKQVYGESFALDALVEPLKALVAGTPLPAAEPIALVERLRILCTVYDPRTGEYRLDYALFVEMAAGLIVLGATIAFLWKNRRPARPR